MNIIARLACCAGIGLLGALSATAQSASLERPGKITATPGQLRFTLEGTLKDFPIQPAKLYLVYDTLSGKPVDSAVVVNGKYKFTGVIDEPVMAWISARPTTKTGPGSLDIRNVASLFLDKGNIKATSTGYIRNVKVTGSAAADAFKLANKKMRMIEDTLIDLGALYRETQDRYYFDRLMLYAFDLGRPLLEAAIAYLQKHPASSINPYVINSVIDHLPKAAPGAADTLMAIYNRMPAALKTGRTAKRAIERLNDEMPVAIGHKAPAFSLQDANGQTVSLAGLKGKYVLLFFQYGEEKSGNESFFASAQQTYQDKGLRMICISVNTNKQTWQSDAQTNGAPWINVWGDNDVISSYHINNSKGNLLIDPAGTIIARNLGGSDIQRTLSDVLD